MSDKKDDHFEILEQSRRAAIVAAANVFDGLSKAKQLRRRVSATVEDTRLPGPGDANAPQNEDFLFDMLRLHANYMNEVARLGKTYRDFAYRALENMYRIANPGLGERGGDELVFTEADEQHGYSSQSLVIRNDNDPSIQVATIDVPTIRDPASSGWKSALKVTSPKPVAPPSPPTGPRESYTVPLPFGQPLAVTLTAAHKAFRHRKYDDYVFVRLTLRTGQIRERRIPVRLDGRSRKEKGSP